MRKNVFGRQLGRDINERKALFKTLASSLVLEERIHTTHAKAKAIRPYIEKLITKSRGGESSLRFIEPYLTKEAAMKMVGQLGPRFAKRPGGYTRIFFAGNRIADNASVAVIEFVEKSVSMVLAPSTKTAARKALPVPAKTVRKTAKKEKSA